ncbi:MAG: diguanylate cyclase [Clostridiales bacterium]|nr:diguanylate cyclase [Clostridiales bacterium]
MLQLISLVIIYGVMMFIWSFVYLNRSHDKINQSFLIFLTNILIWMVLNNLAEFGDGTPVSIVVKTVYWLSMMYLSVTFLFFTYRLLRRRPDWQFFLLLGLNTATVVVRYLYPIDYTESYFWRMNDPVVAPLMSLAFSLPAIFALYLVLRQIVSTKDARQRAQMAYILFGSGLALMVSVLSEYLLPAVFHVTQQLYLMYYAIAIFVVAVFTSIMRHRLLNLRSDYIFRNLFFNASEGILIVNRFGRIVSINHIGREILHDDNLDAGDLVSSVLPDYRFDTDYRQQEVELLLGGQARYLTMTQYPLDERGRDTTKLLLLTDVTQTRRRQEREKERLIEKSSVDPLTGLFNKYYLREKYDAQAAPKAETTSLLFIDVDDFKSINDQYGHLLGDEVLRELATCIKQNIRGANDATRFGGDEFVIVLEDTVADDAFLVAERIRNCANELKFTAGDTVFHITLSIGLIEGTGPLNELIDKADRAMYRSKNKGKNTTTRFSEDGGDGSFHMRLT